MIIIISFALSTGWDQNICIFSTTEITINIGCCCLVDFLRKKEPKKNLIFIVNWLPCVYNGLRRSYMLISAY